METLGFLTGIICLLWCIKLQGKVSRLERSIKEAGIGQRQKDSLREVLEKNTGRAGKLEFENGERIPELTGESCKILDVDEDWILLCAEKKNIQRLVRIDSVKSIQFTT